MPRPRKDPTESIRIRTDTKATVKAVAEHFGVPAVDAIGMIIERFASLTEAEKAEWLGRREEAVEPKVVNGMVLGSYLQNKFAE
tara:strand:+ start:6944 stop:7195 length:252 start_codon:yes stop_codon:yes gene_type:complete